jgi:hypothetical protein
VRLWDSKGGRNFKKNSSPLESSRGGFDIGRSCDDFRHENTPRKMAFYTVLSAAR